MQDFCPNRKYEENEPKNYCFNPNLAWLFNLGWGGGGCFPSPMILALEFR